MTDFFRILQQAQEMTGRLKTIQEELKQKTVTGSSGGGMVTVEADGRGHVRRIKIEPGVVSPDDTEMLEDLIVAAVSDAQKRAADVAQEEMNRITGDLPLPFKFPL
jgi:hypothetical protein